MQGRGEQMTDHGLRIARACALRTAVRRGADGSDERVPSSIENSTV